ncbi:hypothetical protein HN51_059726 [Arachis hypogaea]|uniref:Uncharacterized protein n=1 Tax=Arachis hypogaea TaxID=3818 RepID=A0A444X6V0_ARAHY|nr:uncharacterized protein LOC107622719 [Arachis ipaensis]XP_016180201.1 uncharacterized protein LOC107622719 [Arachis ipaensis]XP_016180203.1 uncharacterized protein LOC107622719 [Arachis ipaensis]XP_016180204.1 uncharacterized protein LOC107622719 [Arachis ipaensis]XP_020969795.1 uncharacterized protein LOC107622719 [Arachis ipaensis]XP_020969796.1 uncharacterized protein LOC107622719 [Arachis ipaensis]XP_020969797.1 uncharacterized protein LOC107622719 [Arachis ipaensis]XP_025680496.1 unc
MAVNDAMNVGSSTVSDPHKAEVMPDVLPEIKIYADENVRDCVFTSELGTSLKGKDEIKTDVEEVEIIVPSDTGVGENEDDSARSVRDAVNLDPQVAGGVVNLKEKDSAEFPSVLGQDDSPLGSNSVVITNASIRDVQLESAHVQFSNSSDAQTLLEKEEENTNSNILPTSVDRTEESPSAQALINDAAKEWNSPARYPTEMKREKWKAKSRPYWIQLVCSSSVDLQRRQKTVI